jgi:hypothetical protein
MTRNQTNPTSITLAGRAVVSIAFYQIALEQTIGLFSFSVLLSFTKSSIFLIMPILESLTILTLFFCLGFSLCRIKGIPTFGRTKPVDFALGYLPALLARLAKTHLVQLTVCS